MSAGMPAQRPIRHLGKVLLGRVLLTGFALSVVFSLLQAALDYRQRVADLREKLAGIEAEYGRALAESLWKMDLELVDALLAGIGKYPYVVRAVIVENGVTTHAVGSEPTSLAIRRQIPLTFDHRGRREPLATLHIEADAALVSRDAVHRFALTFLFQLATVGITGTLLLLMFNHLVTRHLAAASRYLESFNTEGTNPPLRLEKEIRPDEIDLVAESFNNLQQRLLVSQRARRESEEKYHGLYREAALGIFHSTLAGRFIDVNPALARMLGYDTPEEVLAAVTSIAEQVYADPPERDDVARQVLEAGGVLTRENRYRRRDGSLWWGLLHLRSVGDQAGQLSHWEGFVEDITERKRVEAALRASEKRFLALFHANPAAVAVTRLGDNRIVDVNPAWQDLTGYAREEIVGQPAGAFNLWVDPAQRDRAIRMIQAQGLARVEAQIRTKDGELRDVLMSGEFVELDGERHLITIGLDITERKKAEQQLQYQANLLANVSDAVVATDRQFNVQYWNAAAEVQYGWEAAAVLGSKFTKFIQPRYTSESRHNVLRSIARQGFWKGELLHNRRDGTLFPVLVTISAVRNVHGWMTGHVAINRDITRRKQAERALQALNVELARSNAELEQFAYAISHDLQEPLRMVSSFLSLIAGRYEERLDDDGREFIRTALEGASRMRLMIDDLLSYSRITTRGQAFGPVPLEEPLAAALRNLALAVGESGARIVHDALPTVLGDRSQLIQLFQNLIGNAIKFRRPGLAPRIVIGARLEDPASGVWTVSVGDNGIGIAPKFIERIFVVFQRLHTAAEFPGSGVGLAICRRILERHGGRIWVESTVGAGSTFFFTLPAAI